MDCFKPWKRIGAVEREPRLERSRSRVSSLLIGLQRYVDEVEGVNTGDGESVTVAGCDSALTSRCGDFYASKGSNMQCQTPLSQKINIMTNLRGAGAPRGGGRGRQLRMARVPGQKPNQLDMQERRVERQQVDRLIWVEKIPKIGSYVKGQVIS
ncbi:hypothetical protein K1719_029595 [Acacia pycnantha]|nr:hypothetical protein K1719_029595 [Acacia pycnantha]